MIDINLLIPIAHASEVVNESAKPGIVGTFGINWMLFLAQLINFGIVVFVLKKFAFGPIAKKLQERSEKIEIALQDAKKIELEKEQFEQWKNEEMQKSRKEAAGILTGAEKEAEILKTETLNQTKKEQEKLVNQAKAQIEHEKTLTLQSAKTELADIITTTSEKILKEKLTGEKDQKLIKGLLGKMK